MSTIVTYTDREPARNQYPRRIVSPRRPKSCCFTDMAEVGPTHREDRWEYQYRRCRACGFTVRVLLRAIPDAAESTADPIVASRGRTIVVVAQTGDDSRKALTMLRPE